MPKASPKAATKKAAQRAADMPSAEPPKELLKQLAQEAPPIEREVQYPTLDIKEYSTVSADGPITPDDMRDNILGWETEKQWQKRMVAEKAALGEESKEEHWLYGDDYHCLDTNKEKVRCFNNAGNRPFDMEWCEKIMKMILWGLWAGPLTVPGETVNGETIRISKYGRVLSGQHQGTALVLADEWLKKSRSKEYTPYYDAYDPETEKYKFWIGHDYPVIETLVVYGLSEDERILRTIDYVKERTVGDMLYTMPLFRQNNPAERKEMTKILAVAIDLLWTRTNAQGYRTHPEIVGFLERHPTLLECVEHIFVENRPIVPDKIQKSEGESDEAFKARKAIHEASGGRRLGKLKLGAGQCAALCYLMMVSETEPHVHDEYRNAQPAPNETMLDWSLKERAKEFWTLLVGSAKFMAVRQALDRLFQTDPGDEDNQGLGGRTSEKFAILAKAWEVFHDHPETSGDPFPADGKDQYGQLHFPDLDQPEGALCLHYSNLDEKSRPLPPGKVRLISEADFKGIDCPGEGSKKQERSGKPVPPEQTDEELARQRAKVDADRAANEAEEEKRKRKPKEEPSALDKLAEQAARNSGNTKRPIARK